ncbi:MAG TPA: serine hydrolase [Mycobacteriales bacterium]|nr:serine hydrolase [Mycobacteriales bacterium]
MSDPRLMAGAPPIPAESLVTLGNWQEPPYNRWGFQHVRDLIPTARIRRGEGPVRELPRSEQDLLGLSFRSGERRLTIAELLDETYTDGFLVLHRGRVVAEHYFTGMTADTTHLLMSVSKSIVAAVAGILAARGALDVTAPVTDVVPELRRTSFEGATVQQLLDMRTGTRFHETYDDPSSDARLIEYVYRWRPEDGTPHAADALEYFALLENDGEHGGAFRYRSVLTDVLGWVVEKAGGARLAEVIARELWQPMGAEFDAEITVDPHGNAMGDGGVCASLRDLGRFGELYRVGSGNNLVPAEWIDDTVRGAPDGAQAFLDSPASQGVAVPPGAHYRNCWWVRDPVTPFFHASGINGQNVFVHPSAELTVAKLSTWPTALDDGFRALTIDATLAIGAALNG